jgi:hypothetical protein
MPKEQTIWANELNRQLSKAVQIFNILSHKRNANQNNTDSPMIFIDIH